MQKRQILVVVVVLAGVSSVVSDEDVKPLDFYKYSLQWPPTACMLPPRGKKCEMSPEKRFTIHGYWPQYNKDTPVPPYCDDLRCTNTKPTSANDVVKILKDSPLKNELMKDWPDLYARQERKEQCNLEFWKCEWRKHGMCSDYADKPSDYFNHTLTLLKGYRNLERDLGFKPHSKVGDILKNLQDKNYKKPQIVCNSESQLLEIRFCYKNNRNNINNINEAKNCRKWVGSKTCNNETADIFLPGGAGGTDDVKAQLNTETTDISLLDGAGGTDAVEAQLNTETTDISLLDGAGGTDAVEAQLNIETADISLPDGAGGTDAVEAQLKTEL